jgi:hypothetical protein
MATSGVYPTTPLQASEEDALIRPVFFYNQLQRPGDTIALHLFEPRYRTMIGRANARVDPATGAPRREFVFLPNFVNYRCAQGDLGVLVELTQCHISADGRANIRGKLRRHVLLAAHWEEEHSGGLAYCRCRPVPAAFAPSPAQQRSTWDLAEALGGDSGQGLPWLVVDHDGHRQGQGRPIALPVGYPPLGLPVYESREIAEAAAENLAAAQAHAVGLLPAPAHVDVLVGEVHGVGDDDDGGGGGGGGPTVHGEGSNRVMRHRLGWSPMWAGSAHALVGPGRSWQRRLELETGATIRTVHRTPEAHVLLRGGRDAVRAAAAACDACVASGGIFPPGGGGGGGGGDAPLPRCWVAEVLEEEELSLVPLGAVLRQLWAMHVEEATLPGNPGYWEWLARAAERGELVVRRVHGQFVGARRVCEVRPGDPREQYLEDRLDVMRHLEDHYGRALRSPASVAESVVLVLEAEESTILVVPSGELAHVSRASAQRLARREALRLNGRRLWQLLIGQRQEGCGFHRIAAEQLGTVVEFLIPHFQHALLR